MRRFMFFTLVVLSLLSVWIPASAAPRAVIYDWPVIVERPPDGQAVRLATLSNAGHSYRCKGYFDLSGDYIISIRSLSSNIEANKLRIWPRTDRAAKAINVKPMTFLGITTSNARMCLGLTAANVMGGGSTGATNFAREVWVWVKP